MKKQIQWLKLIGIILLLEAIGGLSSFISGNIKAVYLSLNLPPAAPPLLVFGIVWLVLYAAIGVSYYLVALHPGSAGRRDFILFWLQIAINFCWSPVFFLFRQDALALILLLALVIIVIHHVREFSKESKLAGGLMAAYLLWLLFATYLNAGILYLN